MEVPNTNPLQWAVDTPPVGKWATCMDPLDVPMMATVTIRANRTGQVNSGNALGPGPITCEFQWRHSPGVFTVFTSYPDDPNPGDLNPDDPANAEEWLDNPYETAWFQGTTPVLQDIIPETAPLPPGFAWLTIAPILIDEQI